MTRNMDAVFITNWQETGNSIPVDQWSVEIEVQWTDDQGQSHIWGPNTERFPNALAEMPPKARRHFMEEMIMAVVRVRLGINTWGNYE